MQRRLKDKWEKDKTTFGISNGIYPDDLFILGESIEGLNEKQKSEDILVPRLDDQLKEAVDLIFEWIGKETKNVYITYSHSYHGSYSKEFKIEDTLKDKLDLLISKSGFETKVHVSPLFDLPYYGKILRFRHGSRQGKNRASIIESIIKDSLIREALQDTCGFHVAFESHSHRRASVGYGNRYAYWVPCYKLLDTNGTFLNPDEWIPDIGCTIVSFKEVYGEVKVIIDMLVDKIPLSIEKVNEIRKQRFNIEKNQKQIIYSCLPLIGSKRSSISKIDKRPKEHISKRN